MKLIAKKSLGQHFLNSPHVLSQIIAAADIQKGDDILEIGPGTGVLTEALLGTGAKIVAVEKDVRAIDLLHSRFESELKSGQLKLIEGDVLESDTTFDTDGNFSIVANIPYYITGAILEKFLEHEPRPEKMVLLVQKEVAERIVARDGKESVLSISVKAFGAPSIVAKVPRGAFTPPPTVDSAILKIDRISDDLFKDSLLSISQFFKILKAGFAHKRKFLISNLSSVLEEQILERVWSELKLDKKVRAEDLTCAEWLEIIHWSHAT